MHAPCQPHYEAICHILHHLKGAPRQGLLYKLSILCLRQVLVMLIVPVVILIDGPPLAIIPLLVVILLPGAVKSIMLLPILMLKLSTEL